MSITRSEVLRRAVTMWQPGTVPYSQNSIHQATGYRQDCSGFVSMCWGIPPGAAGGWGGQSTVTLVTQGWMREIPASDLKPGDAVGICGPGSAGDDGHIVLFERWANDNPNDDHYWLYEQAGSQRGPVHRVTDYPYGGPVGAWRAYRFRDITDGTTPTPGGDTMSDYSPLGRPPAVGDRGDSVLLADIWYQLLRDDSPYIAGNPAPFVTRQRQMITELDAIRDELAEARKEIAAMKTGGVDIDALATAITARLSIPGVPTVAQIAKAVADEQARRQKE